MVQDKIHPKTKEVEIIFPEGKGSIKTKYTGSHSKLHAGTYFLDHPAWSGKNRNTVNEKDTEVKMFNDKFASFFKTTNKS